MRVTDEDILAEISQSGSENLTIFCFANSVITLNDHSF